jgi:hypothetical protein
MEGLASYDYDFIPGAITGRHKSSATYQDIFHSPNPTMLVGSGAGIPQCGPANAATAQQGSGPSQNPPSPLLEVPQISPPRGSLVLIYSRGITASKGGGFWLRLRRNVLWLVVHA